MLIKAFSSNVGLSSKPNQILCSVAKKMKSVEPRSIFFLKERYGGLCF
jgi:hypothetical protein